MHFGKLQGIFADVVENPVAFQQETPTESS
jgi:hypothetical protein